jgi:hypothetical protein
MAARLTAIACAIAGGLLYWAALGSDMPQAYLFPQMLALAMAALGAAMVISAFAKNAPSAPWARIPWFRILPGMAVLAVFLAILQTVGFYLSSWLAFSSIGILYAPVGERFATAKRVVPASIVFLAVLYLVFWTLLQVQLPRGFAF